MNDTTLSAAVKNELTAVHDSLSTVHLAVPASEIIARGRRRRTWHRRSAAAGAGALAGGLALAVAVLVPGGTHSGSRTGAAQLTAWTVTKLADGDTYVQIRELHDPAGLQARLRADGIPPASALTTRRTRPAARIPRTWPCSSRSSPSPAGRVRRRPAS